MLLKRKRCPVLSSPMRSLYRRISDSTRHCVSAGGRERPPPKYCSYSIFSVRTSRSIRLRSSSIVAMGSAKFRKFQPTAPGHRRQRHRRQPLSQRQIPGQRQCRTQGPNRAPRASRPPPIHARVRLGPPRLHLAACINRSCPGGSTMWLLWTILIGILVGWLAGLIVKGRGMGVLVDLILGILGSLAGPFLFCLLGLASYGLIGSLVISVVGAVLLLLLIPVIKRA